MMIDLKAEKSEFQDMNSHVVSSPDELMNQKACSGCHTTKTPLWRGGPAGPKSLCNACGIRYNKRRREEPSLDSGSKVKKIKRMSNGGGHGRGNRELDKSLKIRLMALGRSEKVWYGTEKKTRKLGEEEQAAMLLMALSCESVYALDKCFCLKKNLKIKNIRA